MDIIKKRLYLKVLQKSNKPEDKTIDEEISPVIRESIISPLIVLTRADQDFPSRNVSPKKLGFKKLSYRFKLPRRKRNSPEALSVKPRMTEYKGFGGVYENRSNLDKRRNSLLKIIP